MSQRILEEKDDIMASCLLAFIKIFGNDRVFVCVGQSLPCGTGEEGKNGHGQNDIKSEERESLFNFFEISL